MFIYLFCFILFYLSTFIAHYPHVQLSLTVNSKSKRKADSLPPLGLEPATLGTLAHLSDCSATSSPHCPTPQQIPQQQQQLKATSNTNLTFPPM
jgi:hypothetical protein